MTNEALLLIDIQDIYFTPGPLLLHKPKEAAKNAAKLLKKFRAENKTVIHIQHDFMHPLKMLYKNNFWFNVLRGHHPDKPELVSQNHQQCSGSNQDTPYH